MNFYGLKIAVHLIKKLLFPIKGKNIIRSNHTKKYKLRYDVIGTENNLDFKKSKLHNVKIYIRGNNNQLLIDDSSYLKNSEIIFVGSNNKLFIGKNTTAEGMKIDFQENNCDIEIGTDCMFSDGIYLSTSDSHSIIDNVGVRINPPKSIKIENHVWLGRNVTVLKGSFINSETIIAANALVLGHLESNSIYAGIPAKKVKDNVNWLRERI